jgi:hypothetical protein
MKRFQILSIVVLLSLLPLSSYGQDTLTNDAVVKLVKAGLSEELIVGMVSSQPGKYQTGANEVIALKRQGISDRIIAEMIKKNAHGGKTTSAGASSNSSMNGYPMPPDKGAYLWDGKKLHLLHQSTVPSMGENVWRKWTPFVRKKFELQLMEPFARVRFDTQFPVIIVSGLGEVIPGVVAFRWLYVKTGGMQKDRRIVGVYNVGGFFGSSRLEDNEIPCEIKKLREGIYEIRPSKPLPDGEYGLVQVPKAAESSTARSFAPPVWDFGIYAEGSPAKQ